MEFTKPVKLNNNDCIHSDINDAITINSQKEFDSLQNKVIDIITEKSLEWFNKKFTREDIVKKMTKKEFTSPVVVKGINFFKTSFELDTSAVEQNFFETIVDNVHECTRNVVDIFTGDTITNNTSENVQETATETIAEPVQTIESVSEQETATEPVQNEDKVLQQLLHEHEHTENRTETATEHQPEQEYEYSLGQTVEVLVGNIWTKAKIVSFEDDSYTVMFNNGKKMTGIMSEDMREIRKITYNKTIKSIKNEIVDAYENKDLEKAYKLSKILKQLI